MRLEDVPTPCFVVDRRRIEENAALLERVGREAGCRIILALKGFAMFSLFDGLRKHLSGTTASGINEALLGAEMFGGEVHVYSPAFTRREVERLLPVADHISFNSAAQWLAFRELVTTAPRRLSPGLRVNPEHSTGDVAIYDPCSPGSRLGITRAALDDALARVPDLLEGIEGLHFHTLCEQNSDALESTVAAFEERFGDVLPGMRWANFGGGHHITRTDYDIPRLMQTVRRFRERWGLEVILEPGEAVALNTGVLIASVLDITRNGDVANAILDTSATAHMPDVLEMPYRPTIAGAFAPGEQPHTYRLGGQTCLAGDVIGDWSFPRPLQIGDRLVFQDMAHYTMVKTTTFNGINLPSIAIWHADEDRLEVVRTFGYEDYKMRLS